MSRPHVTKLALRLWATATIAVFAGCEEDALAPVPNFNGEECQDLTNCGEGNFRLDAGFRFDDAMPGSDSGDPSADGGADSDAGPAADTGSTDTGVFPDSGVPPPPSVFLDLRTAPQVPGARTYATHYVFDISSYFFGISGIAGPLDTIDQALSGNIDTGFPPLDLLIQAVVSQYVPAWVGDLVDALNTIANVFDQVEAFGTMAVTQDPPINVTDPTTAIHGTETWGTLFIRLIDRCPLGRSDPNWPACAQVPIPITNSPTPIGTPSGSLDVQVYVEPFDGALDAGIPSAAFIFQGRVVELELQKLVLLVLNVITQLTTSYSTLQQALQAAVDCPGLGLRAYNFAVNNIGLSPFLAGLAQDSVEDSCNDVINGVINGIAGIAVGVDAFEFDQRGLARDTIPGNGVNTAELLEDLASPSGPDRIDGTFGLVGQSSMGGNWDGRR